MGQGQDGAVSKQGSGRSRVRNVQGGLSREDGEQPHGWVEHSFWERYWEQGGAGFTELCKTSSSETPHKHMRYVWHVVRNLSDHN